MKRLYRKLSPVLLSLGIISLVFSCSGGGSALFEECEKNDDCPVGQICVENSCYFSKTTGESSKMGGEKGESLTDLEGKKPGEGAGETASDAAEGLRDRTGPSEKPVFSEGGDETTDAGEKTLPEGSGEFPSEGNPCQDGDGSQKLGEPCQIAGQKGLCQKGIFVCRNGRVVCQGPKPTDEICDGEDNDCDGQTDESDPNLNKKCTAPNKKGLCAAGTYRCHNGKLTCTSETKPADEICDGRDNDCDGEVDEGADAPCYSKSVGCAIGAGGKFQCQGECRAGKKLCINGKLLSACVGEQGPSPEICDGKDNDCDGEIDENTSIVCYPSSTGCVKKGNSFSCKGICQVGERKCVGGKLSDKCESYTGPEKEVCDGRDNDCDGVVDEEDSRIGKKCTDKNKKGICQHGVFTCRGGKLLCDTPKPAPSESCDGKDNDCDGVIDENCQCKDGDTQECFSGDIAKAGTGRCKKGKQTCINGQWGKCLGEVLPTQERCNSRDDDCDGQIDENLNLPCYPPKKSGCTLNGDKYTCIPPCSVGTRSCQNGKWGQCQGATIPQKEVCDGKDNDCDGKIDNGLKFRNYYRDLDGDGYGSGAPIFSCKKPGDSYVTKDGDCDEADKKIHPNAKEVCDGKDNNCNGKKDEGLPQQTYYLDYDRDGFGDINSPKKDCAQPSGYVSNASDCNDQNAFINPKAREQCDNIDNNCDGYIDNIPCQEPNTGCLGVKSACRPNSNTEGTCIPMWYYRDKDNDGFLDKDNRWCPKKSSSTPPPDYKPLLNYKKPLYSRSTSSQFNNAPFDCNDRDKNFRPNRGPDCNSDKDYNCNGIKDKDECSCNKWLIGCNQVKILYSPSQGLGCYITRAFGCYSKRCYLSSCKSDKDCNICGFNKYKCVPKKGWPIRFCLERY